MSARNLLTAAVGAALIAGSLLGGGIATAAPSPYSSSGTWLVPSEIAPGTYRAVSNDGTGTGYWEVCADYVCEIGTNGFIDNDFFSGNSIMVVPPNAVSVELDGVALTRMG